MPKVSQEHLDARRQQILDASVRCFSRRGIHSTTMQEIFAESKLSAGAVYRYFRGKQEIILAIAERRHRWERELIEAAFHAKDAGEAFQGLAHSFFGALADDTEKLRRRIGIEMWAEALQNPSVLEFTRAGVDVPLERLTGLIRRAQEAGELTPHLDAQALGRVMIALFQGFILQQAWDPGARVQPYLAVIDWLLHGLLEPPTDP